MTNPTFYPGETLTATELNQLSENTLTIDGSTTMQAGADLMLGADPTQPKQAATMEWVQAQIAEAGYIGQTGGTISGLLALEAEELSSWAQSENVGIDFSAGTPSPHLSGTTIQSWLKTATHGGFGVYHTFFGTNLPTTNLGGGAIYSRMFSAAGGGNLGVTPVGITSEVFRGFGSDANDGTQNQNYSPVPRGNTATTANVTSSTTLPVADVSYFSINFTNATDGLPQENVTSAQFPLSITVAGTITASCVGVIGNTGTTDPYKGLTGAGTLELAAPITVASGVTVVSNVQGCALEAANLELRSYSGLPSSIDGAMLALEIDMSGDGPDDGSNRSGTLVYWSPQVNQSAPAEIQSMHKLITANMGYVRTAFLCDVSYSQSVLDLRLTQPVAVSGNTITNGNTAAHAIWLPDNAEIAFDTAGQHRIGYNTYTGNIEIRLGPNSALWPTINSGGSIEAEGLRCDETGQFNGAIGFFGSTPVARQTVTGAKGGNAALASLLTALVTLGLVTDSTTA